MSLCVTVLSSLHGKTFPEPFSMVSALQQATAASNRFEQRELSPNQKSSQRFSTTLGILIGMSTPLCSHTTQVHGNANYFDSSGWQQRHLARRNLALPTSETNGLTSGKHSHLPHAAQSCRSEWTCPELRHNATNRLQSHADMRPSLRPHGATFTTRNGTS